MTISEEFEAFWAVYPRRIARLAAQKAFVKARKLATFTEIIDGVQRYVRGKPSYAEWAHASSWLNAGRWLDEYNTPVQKPVAVDWYDECGQVHNHACELDRHRHMTRMRTEGVA